MYFASRILKTGNVPTLIPHLVVGLIFLSEGLQKFITPAATDVRRFTKIGFSNPSFWAYFTGSFEIACGILVVLGLPTRLATIPLLIIMLVQILTNKGFWSFAHEYRTDCAMTMLLIYQLIYGGGRNAIDKKLTHS